MSNGEVVDDSKKMGKGLYSLKDGHPESYGFHRIRRRKGMEVAVGSKEASFLIFRLWDT